MSSPEKDSQEGAMRLLSRLTRNRQTLREIFLDEAAYAKAIDAMAIDSAARMARGGVALQHGDVISESEFDTEMNQLQKKVKDTFVP